MPTPPTSASTTNPISSDVPERGLAYGAEQARLVDCRDALVEEGLAALHVRRLPHQIGQPGYFNTTPLGRAVTGTLLVTADARGRRRRLGRRIHLQGQRHRAVLPLRSARQPQPADLQALAGQGVRRPSSVAATRCASGSPTATCRTGTPSEKAYSTDANIWGATHEAKSLEDLDTSLEIVSPIMGVRFWDPEVDIETEDVTVEFDKGRPVAHQRQDLREPRSTW